MHEHACVNRCERQAPSLALLVDNAKADLASPNFFVNKESYCFETEFERKKW